MKANIRKQSLLESISDDSSSSSSSSSSAGSSGTVSKSESLIFENNSDIEAELEKMEAKEKEKGAIGAVATGKRKSQLSTPKYLPSTYNESVQHKKSVVLYNIDDESVTNTSFISSKK
jgi:hypothetical protein